MDIKEKLDNLRLYKCIMCEMHNVGKGQQNFRYVQINNSEIKYLIKEVLEEVVGNNEDYMKKLKDILGDI